MGKWRRLPGLALPALVAVLLGATACAPSHPLPTRASPSPSPTATPLPAVLTVIAPLGVNIRSGPSTGASVVGVLPQGATIAIVGQSQASGGWWEVSGSGQSGWVTAETDYTSPNSFQTYEAGGAVPWSVMYPTTWTFAAGASGEVKFTDASGDWLSFYSAASTAALPAAAPQGATQQAVSSTEVYGVTGPLVTYASNSAYLASVEVQAAPGLALLINCSLPTKGGAATLQLFLNTVYIS